MVIVPVMLQQFRIFCDQQKQIGVKGCECQDLWDFTFSIIMFFQNIILLYTITIS